MVTSLTHDLDIDCLYKNEFEDYEASIVEMEAKVASIIAGDAREEIWFLEYPPLFTAGTSAKDTDLLNPDLFPVHKTGRGGQYTYHGPGMRIIYLMLDLKRRNRTGAPDLRQYISDLEQVIINCLKRLGIEAKRREGRVGIWVRCDTAQEAKIAAIGVRVRKWVAFHGVAINIDPDLSHYSAIVPCGISEYGVTSLKEQGVDISMHEFDALFQQEFHSLFGEM
ncbi:MAG: lipoyl(octanoyl) transferase LipB [Rickettsiales bacterium]|nr:lipoyl(octanoyl) transferase LipB [Rickettsiales bacterium]